MTDRCQEYRERIAGLLIGDLPASNSDAVERHVLECPDCRAYQEGLLQDDRLLNGFVESVDDKVTRLEGIIMESIDSAPLDTSRSGTDQNRWSWLFGSKVSKFAAAAIVIVAIVAGANLLGRMGGSNVVWADMMRQVEDARDFICHIEQTNSAEPGGPVEMVKYRSGEYGLRADIYRGGKLRAAIYMKPSSNIMYTLVHRDRSYALVELSEEQFNQAIEESSARRLVEYFKSFDFEELGRKEIDGVTASGIQLTNPIDFQAVMDETTIRLWVDVETNWPVRIEFEATAKGGDVRIKRVMDDFQWNAPLSAKDFEFEIPEDYTFMGKMDATQIDEESAIEALRGYASFTRGKYPSVLSYGTAIYEAEKDIERHKREGTMNEDLFRFMTEIQIACAYYVELIKEDMDPAYYGEDVDTRDFDKVLMRWRLEDGRYRVVYGDLRTEDVSPERLAELEEK